MKTKHNELDYQPEGLQLVSVRSMGVIKTADIRTKLESAARTGRGYPRSLMSQRRKI